MNQVHHADCLGEEGLCQLPDKSIDMILSDLPYGITANHWDIPLDLDALWIQYKRILKSPGTVVLTACQPFTTDLINSAREWFRYCIVWDKLNGNNFLLTHKRPLITHEDIIIFFEKCKYNRQKLKNAKMQKYSNNFRKKTNIKQNHMKKDGFYINEYETNKSIIKFKKTHDGIHTTQKPIKLFEYLIKTYSDEGDIILDNCAGSGTTAIAAMRTGRRFILFEKEQEYYDIIIKRLQEEKDKNALFNQEEIKEPEQLTI